MPASLDRLGLWFPCPALERRFAQSYIACDLPRRQATMLVGVLVFYAFFLWDWVIDPAHVAQSHAIRLAVVTLVMLPLTALLSLGAGRARVEAVLLAYSVVPVVALSIVYAIVDYAQGYVACMITATLFVSTLLTMRLPSFAVFCLLTAATAEGYRLHLAGLGDGARAINTVPLLIAMVLAAYAVAMREAAARRQWTTDLRLRREKERATAALDALRRAQTQLVQAEKLASLGRLVAGVAHEINTPLGVALTAATTIEREVEDLARIVASGKVSRTRMARCVERLNEGVRLIAANLGRADALVGSFKQVAADRVAGERRPIAVAAWLRELVTSLGPLVHGPGHTITLDCPDDLVADTAPGALAQVLTNLIANAVTHGYGAGTPGTIGLRAARAADEALRIAVTDTGTGIPPEHLETIFDPFFTTRRGTGSIGLGLHIAHNLVVGPLGGTIRVESEPGRGTTFVLDLPDVRCQGAPARSGRRALSAEAAI